MRVAAVQMQVGDERSANLARAGDLLARAADLGSRLVVLPELFNLLGDGDAMRAGAEPLDGPTLTWAADQARTRGMWLLAGSITERLGGDHNGNTSCLFDPDGAVAATYRKIHLFDNDVPGAAYRESATVAPGDELVTADVDGLRVGLATCYDLRFPEQFRILALRGAELLLLPSAFTHPTGAEHWETLIRARAIENQCYVLAANQVGTGAVGIRFWGHSMLADPWGTVVATAPDGDAVVVADVDRDRLLQVRAALPSLANRRPDLYVWPEP